MPVPPPLRIDGPATAPQTVVLAHGAGAPMDSPFMGRFAAGCAATGRRCVRFEFPYMAARRLTGIRKPPDRPEILAATWRAVVAEIGAVRPVIGGKSLGGRIATMIADDAGVAGLVCLGYPFHPPGRPETTRIGHLAGLRTPTLIVQGTRDPFGSPEEVAGYPLSPVIRVHWIEGGDHGFAPPAHSARTEAQNLEDALGAVVAFLDGLWD